MAASSTINWQAQLYGFSVAPSANCPHVAAATFQVSKGLSRAQSAAEGKAPRRNLYQQHCACSVCGDAAETWVCLTCSMSACSRHKAGHMVDHANDRDNDHSVSVIAISLADLSVWCFACDEYITHPKLESVFQQFHMDKFGVLPSDNLHAPPEHNGRMTLVVEEGHRTGSGSTQLAYRGPNPNASADTYKGGKTRQK